LIILIFPSIVCRADESSESAPASQQLQGFNLNGYNNTGQKAWDVNGAKADISDTNIQITNVDANFYGKDKTNLTSDHGTIDKTNGNVHLQDNVVVTGDRGTKMTTDTLNWNRDKDLVTTQDPVKIVDQQGVVTGQGLTAHPNLKKAQIDRDVKAVVKTDRDWIPGTRGCSLYIRPCLIGTENFLGLRPANEALFFVILSPVGTYYAHGFEPVKVGKRVGVVIDAQVKVRPLFFTIDQKRGGLLSALVAAFRLL